MELSFIIYSIFLFIKSSTYRYLKNISVLDWCLILRLFIFVIIWLNRFFLKKKQVINPSGVHDPIHGYNMLAQVTRFTSLTCLPIELDIFFSFWFLFFYFIIQHWICWEIYFINYFCLVFIRLSRSKINIFFRVGAFLVHSIFVKGHQILTITMFPISLVYCSSF